MKRIADLSDKQQEALIADLLVFFMWSEDHKGRKMGELETQFAQYDQAELAEFVRGLASSKLIWKRGDTSGTIYITSKLGEKLLGYFRNPD